MMRINLHIDITEDGMSIEKFKIFYDQIFSSMENKTNVYWKRGRGKQGSTLKNLHLPSQNLSH